MIYLFTSSEATINIHYFWCDDNSEYYRIFHNVVTGDKWYRIYHNNHTKWVSIDDYHVHKLIIPTNLNITEMTWNIPDISICHQELEKIIFNKLL